jgi:hypothetical protein
LTASHNKEEGAETGGGSRRAEEEEGKGRIFYTHTCSTVERGMDEWEHHVSATHTHTHIYIYTYTYTQKHMIRERNVHH